MVPMMLTVVGTPLKPTCVTDTVGTGIFATCLTPSACVRRQASSASSSTTTAITAQRIQPPRLSAATVPAITARPTDNVPVPI